MADEPNKFVSSIERAELEDMLHKAQLSGTESIQCPAALYARLTGINTIGPITIPNEQFQALVLHAINVKLLAEKEA